MLLSEAWAGGAEGLFQVFQRRWDGSVNFLRDWYSYKRGFGNQLTEFWMGNDNIHFLTSLGKVCLHPGLGPRESNPCTTLGHCRPLSFSHPSEASTVNPKQDAGSCSPWRTGNCTLQKKAKLEVREENELAA